MHRASCALAPSRGSPPAPRRFAPERDTAANPSRGLGRRRGSRATVPPPAALRRPEATPGPRSERKPLPKLYARRHFFFPPLSINEYNKRVMDVVKCEAQDLLLNKLLGEDFLTEEERNTQPRFQFVIMNRRNTENLVEDLLSNFEYQVQNPYIIYRNAAKEVTGIWFYDPEECEQMARLFSRIHNAFSRASPKEIVSAT